MVKKEFLENVNASNRVVNPNAFIIGIDAALTVDEINAQPDVAELKALLLKRLHVSYEMLCADIEKAARDD